ncbi:hypothetical protein GGR52DRAFT_381519 [Hypoxylon sp. FL1284]|nr:hypothetical protein GGR52DRAFT_381519 [Hypoxylon sp. FL1284]
MTNLGPLTTTFTPSGAQCTSTFLGFVQDNAWVQYGVGGGASSACLPTSFQPLASYYYSPGICPSGYTTACQAQISPSSGTASETVATCCPSAYSCRDSRSKDPFACLSCFDGPKTLAVSTFFFSTNSEGSTTRIDAGTTTVVIASNCIRAYGPIVRAASGDILATASTGVPSSTQQSGLSASVPTTPVTTHDRQNSSSGLSTGAAAGIGIGCGLGALLAIGAIVTMLRRRRRRSTSHLESTAQTPPTYESDKFQRQHQAYQHPYELSA